MTSLDEADLDDMNDVDVDDGDDEAGFDGGDLVLLPSSKGKRAAYQVDYFPLSKVDLAREMKKEIDHVAGALSLKVRSAFTFAFARPGRHCSIDKVRLTVSTRRSQEKDAAALLRYMKWNKERVIEVRL